MLVSVGQGVLDFRVITKMTVSVSASELNCNESTEGTGLSPGSCTFWCITLATDLFTDKKANRQNLSSLLLRVYLLLGVWLANHWLSAVFLLVLRSGRTIGSLGFLRSLMACWRSGCPQNTFGCLTWFFTTSKSPPPPPDLFFLSVRWLIKMTDFDFDLRSK